MANGQQIEVLSYSVRPRVVLKFLGQLFMALAVMTSVTLAVSLLSGEYSLSSRYGVLVFLIAVMGVILSRLRAPSGMQVNEALVITALIFIITPLFMTYPMMASGLSFIDALFEAVSGITTTGLSTTAGVEDMPVTFLFARAWLQWSGGLGIVVLSVALLIGPGIAARRLAYTDIETTDIAIGARIHARRVLVVYITLTAFGFIILMLFGVDFLTAVVHILAAVSTGGYSSFDDSLAGFGRWHMQAAVVFISFLGAIPLSLYYGAYRNGIGEFFRDKELHALLILCLAASGLLTLSMVLSGMSWSVALWNAPLIGLSAQTTAGFSSLPVPEISSASKLVLILSMAVGGSAGSTAGGVKVLRLLIFLKMLHILLARAGLPGHAVVGPRLEGKTLESTEIEKAILLVLLFTIVIAISWIPFVVYGYDPFDSLFEVVSATGTVGLSTGVTSPELPVFLKGVLCLDMLMGRLEIVAILILLYSKTWFGRRAT